MIDIGKIFYRQELDQKKKEKSIYFFSKITANETAIEFHLI